MHKSVVEFSVETIEIAGLGSALIALRLPYGKGARSSGSHHFKSGFDSVEYGFDITHLDRSDFKLISSLVKQGDSHSKVLRGICVWCMINAPRYWWVEMDTYRVGAERLSSESTMHIEGKGLTTDELVEMKENLQEGHMQKRVWMFSYQTLRRIYQQRKGHRLPQWEVFCNWIESLPFAKELILASSSPIEQIHDFATEDIRKELEEYERYHSDQQISDSGY